MNWGNCMISKKEVKADGKVHLFGTINEEDKDYKGTKKLTWLANDPATLIEIEIVENGHLITTDSIPEGVEFKDIVNNRSQVKTIAYAEGACRSLQQGTSLQFERRGYYFVDKVALKDRKLTVNFVPDGRQTNMSKVTTAIDAKETAKGMGAGKEQPKKKEEAKEGGKKAANKEAKKLAKQAAKEGKG